jgi:hypothetical protein
MAAQMEFQLVVQMVELMAVMKVENWEPRMVVRRVVRLVACLVA